MIASGSLLLYRRLTASAAVIAKLSNSDSFPLQFNYRYFLGVNFFASSFASRKRASISLMKLAWSSSDSSPPAKRAEVCSFIFLCLRYTAGAILLTDISVKLIIAEFLLEGGIIHKVVGRDTKSSGNLWLRPRLVRARRLRCSGWHDQTWMLVWRVRPCSYLVRFAELWSFRRWSHSV